MLVLIAWAKRMREFMWNTMRISEHRRDQKRVLEKNTQIWMKSKVKEMRESEMTAGKECAGCA